MADAPAGRADRLRRRDGADTLGAPALRAGVRRRRPQLAGLRRHRPTLHPARRGGPARRRRKQGTHRPGLEAGRVVRADGPADGRGGLRLAERQECTGRDDRPPAGRHATTGRPPRWGAETASAPAPGSSAARRWCCSCRCAPLLRRRAMASLPAPAPSAVSARRHRPASRRHAAAPPPARPASRLPDQAPRLRRHARAASVPPPPPPSAARARSGRHAGAR